MLTRWHWWAFHSASSPPAVTQALGILEGGGCRERSVPSLLLWW